MYIYIINLWIKLNDYYSKIERYTHEIYSLEYLLDLIDDDDDKSLEDKQHISILLHQYECKLMKTVHIKNIVYYN